MKISGSRIVSSLVALVVLATTEAFVAPQTTTSSWSAPSTLLVLESSPKGQSSPVSRTAQSGPPLPYGGDLVPRQEPKQGLDALKDLWINFQMPSVAQLKETFTVILQDNILGKSESSKGEIYFIIQILILYGIAAGSVPLIGGALNFVAGPCLMLSGIATMTLTAARMGPALSPWPVPNENTELLTSGFYAYVRHPMYAGLLASTVGFSIWTGSALRLALTLGLWYALHQKVQYEEAALVQKFGEEYSDYQQQVPDKFIPKEGAILGFLPGWDTKDKDVTMY